MKSKLLSRGISVLIILAMLVLLIPSTVFAATANVAIDAANFPDATFRQYVGHDFDDNHDGVLSAGEASYGKTINLAGMGITSLKGIEYFTELESLNCSNNELTELDVSNNLALTYLNCSKNKLRALDLVYNDELLRSGTCVLNNQRGPSILVKEESNGTFTANMAAIDGIVVGRVADVDGAEYSATTKIATFAREPHDIIYYYDTNPHHGPNMSVRCPSVVVKSVQIGVEVFEDDIFRAYVCEHIDTNHDGTLSADEILAVETLGLHWMGISSMDGIELFVALKELDLNANNITELDLTGLTNLEWLDCSENRYLASLNVSTSTALTYLDCSRNALTELDVSNNTALTYLNFAENQIKSIDLSNNTVLEKLYGYWNCMPVLDLSNNTALQVAMYQQQYGPSVEATSNSDGTYSFNIADVVGAENLHNVTDVKYADFDETTGIVTINELRDTHYFYDAGCVVDPSITMEVVILPYVDHSVPIDEEHFPDEIFRDYIENEIDTNSDGYLSEAEIAATTSMDVSDMHISSLVGIEYFTELVDLDCTSNDITALDLSNNENLEDISIGGQTGPVVDVVGQPDGTYTADLSTVVGDENIGNITGVKNGTYDPTTGIATFTDAPEEVVYYYDPQCPTDEDVRMDVTCEANVIPYIRPVPTLVEDPNLTFTMSITTNEEIKTVFTVLSNKLTNFESFYLVVSRDDASGTPAVTTFGENEGNVAFEAIEAGGVIRGYRGTYTGVYASMMGDKFTATLYALDEDTNELHYNTLTPAAITDKLFTLLNSGSAAEQALAIAMLNYGAEAQKYFDYDTDNLVNASLTEEQKTFAPPAAENKQVIGTDKTNATGLSISLKSKVVMTLTATKMPTGYEKLELVVKDAASGDELDRVPATKANATAFQAKYDNIGAAKMRTLMTFALYDGETRVSNEVTWSVESYVAQKQSDPNLVNMVNAMLIYGDAVAAAYPNG